MPLALGKKIAVVTDAVSPDFYFPLFCQHYRKCLKDPEIYVVTLSGRGALFEGQPIFRVIELPSHAYDDDVRAKYVSELVSELVDDYACVFRVDCDEFLVADPRIYASLQDFADRTAFDHVTAKGMDLMAPVDAEPINLGSPILIEQRKHVLPLDALNKTCFTRRAMRWGRGFHYCDQRPMFDALFLFHCKRADILLQFNFAAFLSDLIGTDQYIKDYYLIPLKDIFSFHRGMFERPILDGWSAFESGPFRQEFLESIVLNQETKIWDGGYRMDGNLVVVPDEFRGRL